MLNNMIKNIKKFIKENYLFLLIALIIMIISFIQLPYYVISGGGTLEIDNKIVVDNEYKGKGSFSFSYVKELRGTPITYLASKIFDYELVKKDDIVFENEDLRDYENRSKTYLSESINNATYVAYTAANKEISTIKSVYTIMIINRKADTDLRVGDVIVSADDKIVDDLNVYKEVINNKNIGDEVKLIVKRNNKEVICYAKIIEIDAEKVLGIYLLKDAEYKTNPNILFDFSERESGSSGGLMMTLSIYNKLVEKDITKGYKIVGTGTIDSDGNVGQIDGVKYKLQGAVADKADVFIVPSGDNYIDVMKIVDDKKYDIKVIEASNFKQVLEELGNL